MDDLKELVGQELAGYKVVAWLGEGGMAAVFRGENLMNPGIVRALKVVRPELAASREFVQRFTKEAMFLEKLRHDNIVCFYGLRQEKKDGLNLLIMELELLEGETLAAWSERTGARRNLAAPVGWMLAAARGVAAAHKRGVVHRDLKPENVFLTRDDEVKVLDFGIARAQGDADREERLTRAGTMPGTPAYMAPEVWLGEVPGEAADVYALGLSLYELLLGRHPMYDDSIRVSSPQLMALHMNAVLPPLRQLRPDAPAELEQLLVRATRKAPAERYANAGELADALEEVSRRMGKARASIADHDSGTEIVQRVSTPGGTELGVGGQRQDPNARSSSTLIAAPLDMAASGAFDRPPGVARAGTTGGAQVGPREVRSRSLLAPAIAGALLLAGGVAFFALRDGDPKKKVTSENESESRSAAKPAPSSSAAPPAGSASEQQRASAEANPWLPVPAAPEGWLLGLSQDDADPALRGFRPAAAVRGPTKPYEIQQHEVTWGEIDPWLATVSSELRFDRPSFVPADAGQRARLPVSGVPWPTANAYCKSLDGALPSEEQWEFAARGIARRSSPWGGAPVNPATVRAYQGAGAAAPAGTGESSALVAVMTSSQDRTDGDPKRAIYDLIGNAMEWTSQRYREDGTGRPWAEAQNEDRVLFAVRGLPPHEPPPAALPPMPAAHRSFACGSGSCPAPQLRLRQNIGFRCVRETNRTTP